MNTDSFAITVEDLAWIDNSQDNPEDLCAHGNVTVLIGDETLQYACCASASALRMLRTLTEDHKIEDRMPGRQMLPCCGFNMFADTTLQNVDISGCSHGLDYAVHRKKDTVVIVTEGGNEYTVSFKRYRGEVLKFARLVEAFYHKSSPKKMPAERFERDGYIAFWNEWRRRMSKGKSARRLNSGIVR